MNALAILGEATAFALAALWNAVKAIPRPGLWLKPFAGMFLGSLPLAAVAGLAIGTVIWMHTRSVLERSGTGAAELLPTFLAAAVLLELAPIGAGLILASRTGASLGAELASMKVNEQLDALAVLGVSPLKRLVGPRVLAATLTGPLLFTLITVLALGSGYVAEMVQGSGTWLKYRHAALDGVDTRDGLVSIFKSLVFGAIVGVIGCRCGAQAGSGSEGVGRAATASVVVSTLLVLVADVLLVTLFKIL
ncbi:ABC transporter permease [soil metagenome]